MYGRVALHVLTLLLVATLLLQCQLKHPDEPELVGTSVFEGSLTDAASGNSLSAALITASGPVTKNANSDAEGNYSVEALPAGTYRITATRAGYIPITKVMNVADDATEQVDFVLSEGLAEDAYRFVLSWGNSPSDLDAHLWSDTVHVYFADRGDDSQEPWIGLDVDDVSSYGPETITIMQLTEDCQFAIHNFSGQNGGDSPITSSEAHIDIYRGSDRIAYYDVPQAGSGYWWYVCDLTASGGVVTRNEITSTPPGSVTAPPSVTEVQQLKSYLDPSVQTVSF